MEKDTYWISRHHFAYRMLSEFKTSHLKIKYVNLLKVHDQSRNKHYTLEASESFLAIHTRKLPQPLMITQTVNVAAIAYMGEWYYKERNKSAWNSAQRKLPTLRKRGLSPLRALHK